MRTDGQTYMTKVIGAFGAYVRASENKVELPHCFPQLVFWSKTLLV
jgi:hypothetical protein